MNTESETLRALKRAGGRAGFHLLRAAVESLKAVEAVIDELGNATRPRPTGSEEERNRPVRIEFD